MGRTTTRKKRKRVKESSSPQGLHRVALFAQPLVRFIPRSRDAILLTLVFVHVSFFLVYVAALVSAHQPTSQVLGDTSEVLNLPGKEKEERSDRPVFLPVPTFLYAAYTVALWLYLVLTRRSVESRQVRTMAMLLAPGTVVAVCGTVLVVMNRLR